MLADALVYGIALYAVGRCSSMKTRAAILSGVFQVSSPWELARTSSGGQSPEAIHPRC